MTLPDPVAQVRAVEMGGQHLHCTGGEGPRTGEVCSVQYEVCSVQCAVCSVQCAVCSVQ